MATKKRKTSKAKRKPAKRKASAKRKTKKRRTPAKKKVASKAPTSTKPYSKKSLYRTGTDYCILYTEGSQTFIEKDKLVKKVAKKLGKEPRLVENDLNVLMNPNHRSNGGRSRRRWNKDKSKMRLVPAKAA